MNNWQCCFSKDGCPYYLNRKTLCSQWEHPYFAKVLTEAADYGDVIYAAYRTALKLLHIRNNMHLQSLRVEMIAVAFNDVLTPHSIKTDEYMTLKQIEDVLSKLYLYCDTSLSRPIWSGAMSSCLLFFFDGKRRGTVNTLGVIILLTALCCDKLATKYSFIFQCLSEHDLVGPQDITHLKKTIFTILTRLQEDKAYKNGYEGNGTSMTRDMFLKWLFTEPKFIVWLSTLHRIHAAVEARHSAKCYVCKEYPIVGLRYRCLQCFNVSLCFQCFTRIPSYGKHDKSHPIEEYCLPSNKLQDVKAFITKVRNNVKFSKNSKRDSYDADVTARRQPATVWHDPKFNSLTYTTAEAELKMHTDPHVPAPNVHTDRELTLKSSGSSQWDECNSLSRGYAAFKNRDGVTVYADRYCRNVLPMQQRQSYIPGSPMMHVAVPHRNTFCEFNDSLDRHYSVPAKTTSDKTTQTPRYTPSDIYCEGTEHYSAKIKYNHNRELYAPSARPLSMGGCSKNLDFYIEKLNSESGYIGIRGSRKELYAEQTPKSTRNGSTTRTNMASAYSEDEGVVINCESDSSTSHYATFDTAVYEDIACPSSYEQKQNDEHKPRCGNRVSCDSGYRGCSWAYDTIDSAGYQTISSIVHHASTNGLDNRMMKEDALITSDDSVRSTHV